MSEQEQAFQASPVFFADFPGFFPCKIRRAFHTDKLIFFV
jgi:hypothetical protein